MIAKKNRGGVVLDVSVDDFLQKAQYLGML